MTLPATDPHAPNERPALGLFGGRFDPVHRAHVAMAQAAADQLGLTEVRWLVTAAPVHKPAVASPAQRLQMVRLALDELGDDRMVADDREITLAQGGQANATWVTIESLQRDDPGRRLVWLMGEDQLQAFTTWQRWEWLVKNMSLAVCARPEVVEATSSSANLERQDGEEQSGKAPQPSTLGHAPPGAHILPVAFSADTVSSSQVRAAIAKGDPIDGLVPAGVARYLAAHNVYGAA